MDGSLVRYLPIDAKDPKHKEAMLSLCKLNDFHWKGVYLHLNDAVPPPGINIKNHGGVSLEELKTDLRACDMRGILALDSTVTKKNPTGKEKVVGFVLYNIDRKEKNQLEVLYLLVHKSYRNQGHGTELMKTCEELHLFLFIENPDIVLDENMSRTMSLAKASNMKVNFKGRAEKLTGHLFSASGHDLVAMFMAKVHRYGVGYNFWIKLGYVDARTLPGIKSRVGELEKDREDFTYTAFMLRAGPKMTAHLRLNTAGA